MRGNQCLRRSATLKNSSFVSRNCGALQATITINDKGGITSLSELFLYTSSLSYYSINYKFQDNSKFHTVITFVIFNIHSNPVITTSVYAISCLYRRIFCGTSYILNHNVIFLVYNDTKYSVPLMT